ncbi:hypothetical protein Tco_1291188, partial [Tanacetum coccineum]
MSNNPNGVLYNALFNISTSRQSVNRVPTNITPTVYLDDDEEDEVARSSRILQRWKPEEEKLLVSEEPDVGRTQEPILIEVSTQEPIMAEVSTQEPIVAEVNTQVPIVEEAHSDGLFFFDDEGIYTEYNVHSSEDASTDDDDDDDDVDKDFLVDEENEIVEPNVDVHLFGNSMDLPFDNIGVTNLVSDDVLEGEDVDVINAD